MKQEKIADHIIEGGTKRMRLETLPLGFRLYRGSYNSRTFEDMKHFTRGFYYGPRSTAEIYQELDGILLTTTLTEPVNLVIVDSHNMKILMRQLEELEHYKITLYMRDGTAFTAKEAMNVVKTVTGYGNNHLSTPHCHYERKPANKIAICTEGNDFDASDYNALVFSKIICWFGYDGFTIYDVNRARGIETPFHHEMFLCNPNIVTKDLRKSKYSS